ncbi:coiled-coil domain-containing protein 60 isoform X2 [Numida meleagris]|uniref:coiled-coil domain-containing protein 60 isoform X2 n=1 Tax=Numida meleagris TaxID=8996 RepID=UPI000B3DCE06|nr:coiled-coil domain-containing protein 60 isoform X2 [Numida meleagris]
MPAPGVPKVSRAQVSVSASTQLRAAVLPESPKDGGTMVPTAAKMLNPRDFVRIQALPASAEREGKVLARSWALYRSSGLPREQVYWENWHRRERQRSRGLFTPIGKPYRELGELLCADPKELTLLSLGQLAQVSPAVKAVVAGHGQHIAVSAGEKRVRSKADWKFCISYGWETALKEPVEKDVQEETPREVAEDTANEGSVSPKSDPLESVKRLTSLKEPGKELKTLSKTLARLRHHISIVKQGGEYFRILHQESLERQNTLKAQKTPVTRWRTDFQPCKYSSDAEESDEEMNTSAPTESSYLKKSGKKKKRITLRSFTPIYSSVLIPRPSEAQSECLFRQLCAIHWLLEALTLESNSSMHSILSCWSLTDPGGFKKSVKEIEEEKLATYMWELFVTNTKKYMRKARRSPFSRKANKTTAPASSQHSSQSSHGQTPLSSVNSLVLCSEDHVTPSGAVANATGVSVQTKQQQFSPSPQKQIQTMHVKGSKGVHGQEDMLKKTGLQSCHISNVIKSKANLCADARHKFMAIREEAACCLHDALESLERSQEERCYKKYQALRRLKYFKEDMERIRQLDVRAEKEHDENELKWFPALLDRLPEPVKNDRYVKRILKKLEKFGMDPDLCIHQDTFLQALTDLQVWELCSPEIAAAVEFVRESVVQMPEEDFSEWFQTKVDPLHAQSSTF